MNMLPECQAPLHQEGVVHGASTTCWGPDMWQVLHGISFHVTRMHAAHAERIVELLGILLPCKFCRESWPVFVAQLVRASGKSVREHVRDGSFAEFVYEAHNLVNDKLVRQRFKKAAAAMAPRVAFELGLYESINHDAVASALERAAEGARGAYAEFDKRPTFECVAKRYFIANDTPFPLESLWRALLVFTINFTDDKAAAFVSFLEELAQCIKHISPRMHEVGVVLFKCLTALRRAMTAVRLTPRAVFDVLALGRASILLPQLDLRDYAERRAYLDALYERIGVATAGTCTNGVCR